MYVFLAANDLLLIPSLDKNELTFLNLVLSQSAQPVAPAKCKVSNGRVWRQLVNMFAIVSKCWFMNSSSFQGEKGFIFKWYRVNLSCRGFRNLNKSRVKNIF